MRNGIEDEAGRSVTGEVCPSCDRRFEDGRPAKLLPCLHTHCGQCLGLDRQQQPHAQLDQNETTTQAERRQVECPTCKSCCAADQVINSPLVRPPGAHHLKPHTDMEEENPCFSCNSCGLASVFCLDCNDYLAGRRQVECPTCKSCCAADQVINSPLVRPPGAHHLQLHTDTEEENPCSSCSSCGLASVFCLDCNDYLCPSCVDAHKRVRLTKLHKLLNLTPDCEESATGMNDVPYSCSLGNDSCLRKIRLYCQDCEVPICIPCKIQKHKDHNCCKIDDITLDSAGQKETLQKEINDLKSKVKQVVDQNIVEKMSRQEKHVEEQKLKMDELRSNFNRCFSELQNFMAGVFDDRILELRSRQEEVDLFTKKAAHTVSFVEQLLQTTNSMSVIAVKGLVSKNISALQDQIVHTHKSCVIEPSISDHVNSHNSESEATPGSRRHQRSRSSLEAVSSSSSHNVTHVDDIKQEVYLDGANESGPCIAATSSMTVDHNTLTAGNVTLPTVDQPMSTSRSVKRSCHSTRLAEANVGLDDDDSADSHHEVKQEAESYTELPSLDSCRDFTEMEDDYSRHTSTPGARMDTLVIQDVRSCTPEEIGAGEAHTNAADQGLNHAADQGLDLEAANKQDITARHDDDVETRLDTTELGASCPKKRRMSEGDLNQNNSSSPEASTSSHDAEHAKWSTIWTGQLEWQDRKAGKLSCRVARSAACHVSVRDGTLPLLRGREWPSSVTMHLMKQSLLDSDTLRTHIKSSRRVQFHFHDTDTADYQKLEQHLQNGHQAGFIDFLASGKQELRFMLLVYTAKKRAYFGLIPEDQKKACSELKKMLQQKQRHSQQDDSKVRVLAYKALHGTDDKFFQPGHDPDDPWEDLCRVCQDVGELVVCDFCPRVYHRDCYVPKLTEEPPSPWRCILCQSDLRLVDQSVPGASVDSSRRTSRKPSDGMTDIEVKVCERILLELYCVEESIFFHKPVPRDNRDYHRMIKKPMDFGTIKSRLTHGHAHSYGSIAEFLSDVKRVFTNCYKFNVDNADIYMAGEMTEELFKSLVLLYLPQHSTDTT